jgi:hypothetical protein
MLQVYTGNLSDDDFCENWSHMAVAGDPVEVAFAARGLLGDHVMRMLRVQHDIQTNALFPFPYDRYNGIIPSDTMLVARAVDNGYELMNYTRPYYIRIFKHPWYGNVELYIEASTDEIRRLKSMLTTDEGWMS